MVVGGAVALPDNYYTLPQYARHNWRGAIHAMEDTSSSTGAVIVNGPGLAAGIRLLLPRQDRAVRPAQAAGSANLRPSSARWRSSWLASTRGLWLVKYYPPNEDPEGIVERWLAEHAYRTSGEWVENATFSYYSLPTGRPAEPVRVGAAFGRSSRWSRLRAAPGGGAGDILQVTLTWRATAPVAEDLAVFVHAVDGRGHLVAQRDSAAGGRLPAHQRLGSGRPVGTGWAFGCPHPVR